MCYCNCPYESYPNGIDEGCVCTNTNKRCPVDEEHKDDGYDCDESSEMEYWHET